MLHEQAHELHPGHPAIVGLFADAAQREPGLLLSPGNRGPPKQDHLLAVDIDCLMGDRGLQDLGERSENAGHRIEDIIAIATLSDWFSPARDALAGLHSVDTRLRGEEAGLP